MTLLKPEFAKVKLKDVPKEIVREYNLQEISTSDRWVYIQIRKGMYGQPKAGSLGHDLLDLKLNKEGYNQSNLVPGLWKHKDQPISFFGRG